MSQGWVFFQHFLQALTQRRRSVALGLLVASLSSPARAVLSLDSSPWSVETPQAAKKRFSLSWEVFGERQKSLRIAAFEQQISVIDLISGGEESGRLPGDPELLNRKFDLNLERDGFGPSFTVPLPVPSVVGAGRVYPTLTIASAVADVSLDFDDVTQRQDSTSLHGRGALFDARLGLIATLCQRCPWFTSTGYRFEKLPSLAVDRSPPFAVPASTVQRDEVRLGREVQEISSRVGYSVSGSRTASFVGVQHRWSDLNIDDRVAFRHAFAQTRLSSRTRLESQTTMAVAGIDIALGRGFFSRLETAIGDGDSLVRLNVAFLPSSDEPAGDPGLEREAEIAAAIVGPLRRLEASLDTWETCLDVGTCSASEFLTSIETELLRILDARELAALRDWVRERFRAARAEAQLAELSTGGFQPVALTGAAPRPQSSTQTVNTVRLIVQPPREMAEEGKLRADLCVTSEPAGADFRMWPPSEPNDPSRQSEVITNRSLRRVYRGIFAYRLRKDDLAYDCSNNCPRLNLVDYPQPTFHCDIRARACTRKDAIPRVCSSRP